MCTRSFYFGIPAVLLISGMASATVTVSFSQPVYTVTPALNPLDVAVFVSSSAGESITGADVFAFLGDGGSDAGGSNTSPPYPSFSNLQLPLFSLAPGIHPPPTIFPLAAFRSDSSSASIIPNGILATLQISLANMQPGTYVLSLGKSGFGATTLYNGISVISPTLGQAQIVYVPEPLSAALLSMGLLVVARRVS